MLAVKRAAAPPGKGGRERRGRAERLGFRQVGGQRANLACSGRIAVEARQWSRGLHERRALAAAVAVLGRITSARTPAYDCIACAANDETRWWWPDPDSFWPASAPLEESVDAFVAAYASVGYAPCQHGASEAGFEKIAIFATPDGRPQHAAR